MLSFFLLPLYRRMYAQAARGLAADNSNDSKAIRQTGSQIAATTESWQIVAMILHNYNNSDKNSAPKISRVKTIKNVK